MKFICSIVLAVGVLLAVAPAEAETSRASAREVREVRNSAMAARKLYRNYLRIRFPWRTCTVWYTARVPYPNYITGYACGTYVVCRRTSGRNYLCRY